MGTESVAAALEREHHEIDDGIADFTAALARSQRKPESLAHAIQALRRHIYLEEEFLFPALRTGGLVAPIFVMLREHGQLWTTLDQLERELDATAKDNIVTRRCRELSVQLQHHNSKEERIIYPQADQALPAADLAKLKAFLDSGQLPNGWICEKARPTVGQDA